MRLSPWSSREPVHDPVLVGELEVGDGRAGLEVAAHGCPPDAVDAGHGGHVEAAAVGVAPGEVVRRLGELDQLELLALGREDPDAAGPADVEAPLGVDLDAVDGVLARFAGQVAQQLAGSAGGRGRSA